MWQNSECKGGLLHDYRIAKTFSEGVVEVCTRCKDKKFFKNNEPNRIYLSYHIRQALQKSNLRFKKEYESTTTNTN